MITPIDVICRQMIHCERDYAPESHYHADTPPLEPRISIFEEANFHLVDRRIDMAQIGFDYYDNIVTYRL